MWFIENNRAVLNVILQICDQYVIEQRINNSCYVFYAYAKLLGMDETERKQALGGKSCKRDLLGASDFFDEHRLDISLIEKGMPKYVFPMFQEASKAGNNSSKSEKCKSIMNLVRAGHKISSRSLLDLLWTITDHGIYCFEKGRTIEGIKIALQLEALPERQKSLRELWKPLSELQESLPELRESPREFSQGAKKITGDDIRKYFRKNYYNEYPISWEDENGKLHQDDTIYLWMYKKNQEEADMSRMAMKFKKNVGGIIGKNNMKSFFALCEIMDSSFDEIADWLENGDKHILRLSKHMEDYNIGVYYTPDGERHDTHDYYLEIMRDPKGPLGFIYCGFGCIYPE